MRFGEAMRIAKGTDWIVPRYRQYLQGKRNHEVEAAFAQSILDRPERDRTKNWSASGAGTCLRSRTFSWLGAPGKPHSDDTMQIFMNGHYVHLRHQVVGLTAHYLNAVEVPVEMTSLNLRGTMDGICEDGVPAEYKSIHQNGYSEVLSFGPKSDHVEQMHSYMLAGEFDSFRIVYENKNTNALKEFKVDRDEAIITKVREDLERLNAHVINSVLPEMLPECKRKEGRYRYCPFAKICAKAKFKELAK